MKPGFEFDGFGIDLVGSCTETLWDFDYDINISGAPIDRTDNILKQYYPGGIDEVKVTFGSEAIMCRRSGILYSSS